MDDPGHRKIHDAPIPLAGGFAVITGMVVAVVDRRGRWCCRIFPHLDVADRLLSYGLNRRVVELGAIVLGALGIVRPRLRSMTNTNCARPSNLAASSSSPAWSRPAGVRITLFVHNAVFSYAVTILWILTVINAFNFMDNMNGLCAGLGAISAWFFAHHRRRARANIWSALLALLVCGALLGFLPHNFPRASAFLGDTGSHLVGYLLAVMAILPHFYNRAESRSPGRCCMPLLVLAVPLGDMVWVVLLRWRLGKPFYIGDNNHLSHRLVRRGWSQHGRRAANLAARRRCSAGWPFCCVL